MYGGSKALDSPHRSACPPALRRVRRAVLHRTGKLPAYGEDPHLRLPGALDLVGQHGIDLSLPDVGQELLQGGAAHVAAGEAAVAVALGQAFPALPPPALAVVP